MRYLILLTCATGLALAGPNQDRFNQQFDNGVKNLTNSLHQLGEARRVKSLDSMRRVNDSLDAELQRLQIERMKIENESARLEMERARRNSQPAKKDSVRDYSGLWDDDTQELEE